MSETIPMLKNFVDVGYKRSEMIRERKKQVTKEGVWMPEGMYVSALICMCVCRYKCLEIYSTHTQMQVTMPAGKLAQVRASSLQS
jgi:hypothetical protein